MNINVITAQPISTVLYNYIRTGQLDRIDPFKKIPDSHSITERLIADQYFPGKLSDLPNIWKGEIDLSLAAIRDLNELGHSSLKMVGTLKLPVAIRRNIISLVLIEGEIIPPNWPENGNLWDYKQALDIVLKAREEKTPILEVQEQLENAGLARFGFRTKQHELNDELTHMFDAFLRANTFTEEVCKTKLSKWIRSIRNINVNLSYEENPMISVELAEEIKSFIKENQPNITSDHQ